MLQVPSGSPPPSLITNRFLALMHVYIPTAFLASFLSVAVRVTRRSLLSVLLTRKAHHTVPKACSNALWETGELPIYSSPSGPRSSLEKSPITKRSWGCIAANLLGYIRSQCELKKRIHRSRPNSFKANNPPESVWKCWNCQCQLTPCIVSVKLQ